jgi:RNA-directed DNA polymerase
MSLQTPDTIRRLQRKLYLKAKAEPAFRFYLLYDKIHREDILRHAYALARANRGAPGVDGVTFAAIESAGLEEWLAGLGRDLVAKTYRPEPVRRVMIPKPGGGERPLGIPTVAAYCTLFNEVWGKLAASELSWPPNAAVFGRPRQRW